MLKSLLCTLTLRNDAEAFDDVHKTIEQEIVFNGARFWILISAIILASVGLNINSAAVIIGAMLISPLMGPINGMGYSLATYDFPLLKKCFQNFTFAAVSSLVALKWTLSTRQKEVEFKVATRRLFMPLPVAAL